MKCLTICQPYAELIMRGSKRVENRCWPTSYRGPLLIHAGKSLDWLELDDAGTYDTVYNIPTGEMAFEAIVGTCLIRGCIGIRGVRAPTVQEAWPWLAEHEHTEGPYCWILEEVRRFSKPIPYRGQRGLFDVPYDVVASMFRESNQPAAGSAGEVGT